MKTALALEYAQNNQRRFVAELQEFVRFPSISAQDKYREALNDCAGWLAGHLRRIGFRQTRILPTRGHPLVFAEWRQSPELPTVLIYGHYDVQPPEPLNEWKVPPFEAVVKNNYLYGRGASDDKGQMFALIKALEAFLRTNGALPVNVKCIFEGEEEIGSSNFIGLLEYYPETTEADAAIVSDMPILATDRPAITYAMRGAVSLELEVRRAGNDAHSGNFGGAIYNPIVALSEIIAKLHDIDGRVTIPGFYDHVRPAGESEKRYLAETGPADEQILKDAKTQRGWGERGFSLYERMTLRPALTITGITGGYQGQGAKAIIPARASAKVDIRLVPDQDPETIVRHFLEHIADLTPTMVTSSVKTLFMAKPVVVDRKNRFTRAAVSAYRKSFRVRPVFVRMGGTIPPVGAIRALLDLPVVMLGFGLPDDKLHAPNERFYLPNFFKGIATGIRFLDEVARQSVTVRPGNPASDISSQWIGR